MSINDTINKRAGIEAAEHAMIDAAFLTNKIYLSPVGRNGHMTRWVIMVKVSPKRAIPICAVKKRPNDKYTHNSVEIGPHEAIERVREDFIV